MRRKEREVTDKEEIRQILEKGQVIRIAMNNGEYPYILPVNYGYEMENGRLHSQLRIRKCDRTGNHIRSFRCGKRERTYPYPGALRCKTAEDEPGLCGKDTCF